MALDSKPKNPWLLFGIIGGVALLIGFAYAIVPLIIQSRNETATLSTPEGVDAMVMRDPRTAPLFATMRQTHPQEYDAFKRQIAGGIAGGSSNSETAAAAQTFVRAAMARHYGELLQAPAAELDQYRETQAGILTGLQTQSPAACGVYAATGELPAEQVPAGMEQLVSAQQVLFWRTAAAGRDRPAGRTIAPPDSAGAQALAAAMRADGISDADMDIFYDDQALARAAPERQCAIFLHLLRGIRTLPEPARADITAFTLRRD